MITSRFISFVVENTMIKRHLESYFNSEIKTLENIGRQDLLSRLDMNACIDQIHLKKLKYQKQYNVFATSNRINFIDIEESPYIFRVKYKRSTKVEEEFQTWQRYYSIDTNELPYSLIRPSYFVQSYVDKIVKKRIGDFRKKGLNFEKLIELINSNYENWNMDKYIKTIGCVRIPDLIYEINKNNCKIIKIKEKTGEDLFWAHVKWENVKGLIRIK
jgi:hypothetical protein